jgi:hypothetical protein
MSFLESLKHVKCNVYQHNFTKEDIIQFKDSNETESTIKCTRCQTELIIKKIDNQIKILGY